MKVGEIIRIMKRQGWKLKEHGSEHDKWAHELYFSKSYICIPRHKSEELSKYVENKIKSAMHEVEKNR